MNTDNVSMLSSRRSKFGTRTLEANHAAATAAAAGILLVDDDADIRESVAPQLRDAGYRVGIAEDGQGAWDALCADTFDLLITDHHMPRLTGLDLVRRVRERFRRLPVIVISGNLPGDDPALQRVLTPGATLPKPFSFHVLLAQVKELLSGGDSTGPEISPSWSRHRRHPVGVF